MENDYEVDVDDAGKAAAVVWAAAVLFARISGFNADNDIRRHEGYAPCYAAANYEYEISAAWKAVRREKMTNGAE